MLLVEAHGKVVRNLSAGRNYYTVGRLKVEDVKHALEGQFVEVETVAHVVVGRHGFGVVIDHYRTETFLPDGVQCLYTAPVEFYGRSDAVGSRSEYHYRTMVVLERNVVGNGAVGEVEVVGLCGIFGSEGVNLLHIGHNACHLTACADGHLCLLHLHFLFQSDGACHLEIGESLTLSLRQEFVVEDIDVADALQFLVGAVNVVELLEEPAVNLRQFMDLVDGITLVESLFDDEDSLVGGCLECGIHIVNLQFVVSDESVHALSNHTQTLLDNLFEGASDGHHFAYGFHAAAEFAVHSAEFSKVPAGNLAYAVVKCRLEECGGGLCHGVLQVEESVAESEFCGDESERISCGLRCQGRGAAESGIDFDNTVVFAFGVEGILYVAFADDAHMADDADGKFAEFVVFGVCEGLRWSDNDGLSGVDAEGVEVFHVADGDAVVEAVAYHLVFHFLPSLEALLHEYLGRE